MRIEVFTAVATALLVLAIAGTAAGDPVLDGAYPGRVPPATDGLNIYFDSTVEWFSDAPKWDEYAAGATATADTFTAYVMLDGPTAAQMTALEFRLRVEADPEPLLLPAAAGVKSDGNVVELKAVYTVPVPLVDDPQLLLAIEVIFAAAASRPIAWYLEPATGSTTGAPAYRDGGLAWLELATLPRSWSDPVIVLNQPYVEIESGTWGGIKGMFR